MELTKAARVGYLVVNDERCALGSASFEFWIEDGTRLRTITVDIPSHELNERDFEKAVIMLENIPGGLRGADYRFTTFGTLPTDRDGSYAVEFHTRYAIITSRARIVSMSGGADQPITASMASDGPVQIVIPKLPKLDGTVKV